jgi:hypothetical protein
MFKTVATLGAGTKLYYEDPEAPGIYVLLDNALTVGQTGEQGEFVDTTPLSKKVREYIASLETPPQKQLTFNDTPGVVSYERFVTLVRNRAPSINMRIDFEHGRRAQFAMAVSGFMVEDPEGAAQIKASVFGQQSGATNWSEF